MTERIFSCSPFDYLTIGLFDYLSFSRCARELGDFRRREKRRNEFKRYPYRKPTQVDW